MNRVGRRTHLGAVAVPVVLVALMFAGCATTQLTPEEQAARDAERDANAAIIVGDWEGEIAADGRAYPVVFHIRQGRDGVIRSTMDSPNQEVFGFRVDKTTFDGTALTLEICEARFFYEGTISDDMQRVDGVFEQAGYSGDTTLIKVPGTGMSQAPSDEGVAMERILGDWTGELVAGGTRLPLVFHLTLSDDGALEATMDSPAQAAYGIPVADVTFDGTVLELDIQAAMARYEGSLDPDVARVDGVFRQSGQEFPVVLEPLDSEASGAVTEPVVRPQDPVPPLPYREQEQIFQSADAGITLAGTVTLPAGPAPGSGYPAVVLVSGSGQQNRDEEIFNHRPFRVIADALTRAGVVVLRYDDRGVGGSGGRDTLQSATTRDFALDAAGALAFVSDLPDVDPNAVGVLGHSEGGIIAAMLAGGEVTFPGRDDVAPAFAILLAGSAIPGSEVLLAQSAAIQAASGVPPETVEQVRQLNASIYGLLLSGRPREETWPEIEAMFASLGMTQAQIDAQEASLYTPWFTWFLEYDPDPALRKIDVPVLALFGGRDLQVTVAENRPAMETALAAAPSTDVTIQVVDRANHLFQPAESGLVAEYEQIETTVMPEVLEMISGWITARF
jgi:pimeloyl-ACP methyl ester carboxylesterase